MTILELGALGEFVGAFAVLATLIYLAAQIRQNTRSMDEGHRFLLAQTFQARADGFAEHQRQLAESEHYQPIRMKLQEAGWPQDLSAIETLTPLELRRFEAWILGLQSIAHNLFYQHEQGFLDEEYYRIVHTQMILAYAPIWDALGMRHWLAPKFKAEIARILEEDKAKTRQS